MTTARSSHAATLLTNGKVLIAGGRRPPLSEIARLASAELYDPSTRRFTATGAMTTPRADHTATVLANGKVLIAGGSDTLGAELYDPSTGTFTATGDMTTARRKPLVTLLADGRVLVAGGWEQYYLPSASAELYHPSTGSFTPTGNMPAAWFGQTGTLLADGTVLIAGAEAVNGVLYHPSTGAFSYTSNRLPEDRYYSEHAASLLINGKVLLTGGGNSDPGLSADRAKLYDPATNDFRAGGDMKACRFWHTATVLPNSTALLTGGDGRYCLTDGSRGMFFGTLQSAELYDSSTGAFAAAGFMTVRRQSHTATLLPDGAVLIAGGYDYWVPDTGNSAELYYPATLVPSPVLFSVFQDGLVASAILHADSHQLVSPANPAVAGEPLEIYGAGLVEGGLIPPQVAIGGRMAEVLYFGNAPGFANLNQVNVRVPGGVTPGPAVPVRLTYIGRPSNEVTIGVQ